MVYIDRSANPRTDLLQAVQLCERKAKVVLDILGSGDSSGDALEVFKDVVLVCSTEVPGMWVVGLTPLFAGIP